MKKLFLLMFAMVLSFSTVSCSSDDDNGPAQPQFTMVGTWKVAQYFVNGVENNVNEVCPFKGNVKFVEGGTYVEDIYRLNDNNICTLNTTIGGVWARVGQNYTITIANNADLSMLPLTFKPKTFTDDINKFEIEHTALGTTTRLVFNKVQ